MYVQEQLREAVVRLVYGGKFSAGLGVYKNPLFLQALPQLVAQRLCGRCGQAGHADIPAGVLLPDARHGGVYT